ncbi:AfsR/SARP family transcriptional regulator [Streptomyces radicis]|uniref:SARP family transcriptional regulator n=1 Tax=Streptomyces radicis TaxID=1750517 RepID=A0A3A9WPQ3_9ACTN|nr:BTAD domain-containing putative transcriptional regulator [Streptomyces radicis]RKN11484.1 SARP family transcriptional regulator [Streptomyces radicis]RKN26497.1 SARP family transcriptional regulator [Streptomyces radicis]
MVDIRLLGAVELRAPDGSRFELGPPQQRCVLALLAMTPGRPVTTETLIDRVWPSDPPANARDALYTYVSRLRRVLGRAGGGAGAPAVRRSAGGYLLDIPQDRIDLHRSRGLVRRAREARAAAVGAAGTRRAAELLGEAAALWHGTPLAGLKGEWAGRARIGLERELVTLLTDRFAMELRLGGHAEAVGPLSAAVLDHPLAEPLVEQLMTALYRSGRQADALAAYARARQQLSEDLGEEPGRALRELHERILRRDPALDPPAPQGAAQGAPPGAPEVPRAPVRPSQLPPDLPAFTGRHEALARLGGLLPREGGGPRAAAVATINGTAGIGKTAFAVHWAHQVAEHFPDGQLYVDLRGFARAQEPLDPSDALRGFLSALEVPPRRVPPDVDGQAALYRSALADKRMLVVLDNARDAEQVRPLLPGSPGSLTVVTSRNRLLGLVASLGARPLGLDLFTRDEAWQMLADRLGPERVAAEAAAVDAIIARCARLPLALAVVAAQAAAAPERPLAELVEGLASSETLDAFAGEANDAVTDLRALFSWSYRALSPPAARLFRLVGLHPGPDLGVASAAALTGLTPRHTRALLGELARAQLVTERSGGRYTLHDLLRAYAAELTARHDGAPARRAATRRVLDHYLHSAHRAFMRFTPQWRQQPGLGPPPAGVEGETFADEAEALAWVTTERATLIAAVERAAADGFDRHACGLAWAIAGFLDRQGSWHSLAAVQDIAFASALRLGDLAEQGRALSSKARLAARLMRYDEALGLLRDALDLFEAVGDGHGQAETFQHIGFVLENSGRLAEALDAVHRARELHEGLANDRGVARALNVIGWLLGLQGKHEEGLGHCQEALSLQEDQDDPLGLAATLDSLGYIHHHLGAWDEAAHSFKRALAVLRGPVLGERMLECIVLLRLGDTYRAIGDTDAAREAWLATLRIAEDLGSSEADEALERLRELAEAPAPRGP